MNIEEFRDFCLSLPHVREAMPWADHKNEYYRGLLCFTVADKWFCIVHVDEFEFCLLKCPPDKAEELRMQYDGIRPGWHMNKKTLEQRIPRQRRPRLHDTRTNLTRPQDSSRQPAAKSPTRANRPAIIIRSDRIP